MDSRRAARNWRHIKGTSTDDDLDVIARKRDQLEGKIQEPHGREKDQTKKNIDHWYFSQNW